LDLQAAVSAPLRRSPDSDGRCPLALTNGRFCPAAAPHGGADEVEIVTASVSKRNSAGVHAGLVLVLNSESVQRHISGCCFNPIV
jgi:hypothetical protein